MRGSWKQAKDNGPDLKFRIIISNFRESSGSPLGDLRGDLNLES